MTVNEFEAQDPALEVTESKVTDADRDKAVNALAGLAQKEKGGAFAPKERSDLQTVKRRTHDMMEELGYDVKDPAVIAAMASFVDNIGRSIRK